MAIDLFLLGGAFILLAFAGILFGGAPYLPSHRQSIEAMLKLARPRPGQSVADLGAGDGRVVIAFAQAGCRVRGYERNPLLVSLGRWAIRRVQLSKTADMHRANFWNVDCSPFEIVVVFGLDRYQFMNRLETKLRRELRPGAQVVSNAFRFPHWQPSGYKAGVFLYRQPAHADPTYELNRSRR